MKRLFLLMTLVMPMVIFAQKNEEPCAYLQGMYDKKVGENSILCQEVNKLREDSIKQKNENVKLLQNVKYVNQLLRETQQQLKVEEQEHRRLDTLFAQCRKDNAQMQKQLKNCSAENIQSKEDSIWLLNSKIERQNDSIAYLSKTLSSKEKEQQGQRQKIKELNTLVSYLDQRYKNKSVDELYASAERSELQLCVDIYGKLGKDLPNIRLALSYLEAKELTKTKYNKQRIEKAIYTLSQQNSNTSKEIVRHLQTYATINSSANKLWGNIKEGIFVEEISNEDIFLQARKKRAIWELTQEFINQHPDLSTKYPYIFDQLQNMLNQIWSNVNNFNAIPNPFI